LNKDSSLGLLDRHVVSMIKKHQCQD